jgi:hypothetical protein
MVKNIEVKYLQFTDIWYSPYRHNHKSMRLSPGTDLHGQERGNGLPYSMETTRKGVKRGSGE